MSICTYCNEPLFKASAGNPVKEHFVCLDPRGGLQFFCEMNPNKGGHEPKVRDLIDESYYNDLIEVKTQILCEVGRALERLRRENPMNGDGSNYMLDKCLKEVMKLDHGTDVMGAIHDEKNAIAKKREDDYRRLEDENAARRNAAAERQDNQGLNQPAG